MIDKLDKSFSIYIHWPFCKKKCPYCDFNSHVNNQVEQKLFLDSYLKELSFYKKWLGKINVKSIFFGGGTPSLMESFLVEKIIEHIAELFSLEEDVEITLEANPTSVEAQKFESFKEYGVNRLSLGIQSFNDKDLKFLGREHSAIEAKKAIEIANSVFNNVSFDLIYALPGQTVSIWQKELEYALTLSSKHLSLYQLTIEKGTQFFNDVRQRKFAMPDENLSVELFDLTNDVMRAHDFKQYEVSNYAKIGYESKHNKNYWEFGSYLGIGAGAHGRVNFRGKRIAIMNYHLPEKWQSEVESCNCGLQSKYEMSKKEILNEMLMLCLRHQKGISNKITEKFFGKKFDQVFDRKKLKILFEENLIFSDENSLFLTKKGMNLTNAIVKNLS